MCQQHFSVMAVRQLLNKYSQLLGMSWMHGDARASMACSLHELDMAAYALSTLPSQNWFALAQSITNERCCCRSECLQHTCKEELEDLPAEGDHKCQAQDLQALLGFSCSRLGVQALDEDPSCQHRRGHDQTINTQSGKDWSSRMLQM